MPREIQELHLCNIGPTTFIVFSLVFPTQRSGLGERWLEPDMTVSFIIDGLLYFPCSSVLVQTIRFNVGAALMTLRHMAPGADHSTSDATGMEGGSLPPPPFLTPFPRLPRSDPIEAVHEHPRLPPKKGVECRLQRSMEIGDNVGKPRRDVTQWSRAGGNIPRL